MFGFGNRLKKESHSEHYDKSVQKPIIRASICTGEQVAGFKDLQNGKFHEVMLIKGSGDLQLFMEKYGVDEKDIVKEY